MWRITGAPLSMCAKAPECYSLSCGRASRRQWNLRAALEPETLLRTPAALPPQHVDESLNCPEAGQRFTEYQNLQGAFGLRALIEQAKGILMARHSISADTAFERLREHSQRNGRKLSDVAAAVVESHPLLLPPQPSEPSAAPDQ
jgi:ANTAR domain-containing protein